MATIFEFITITYTCVSEELWKYIAVVRCHELIMSKRVPYSPPLTHCRMTLRIRHSDEDEEIALET